MSYIHVDTFEAQRSKRPGEPCGDVILSHRDANSTVIVLTDGIGSGVRANIYAHLCASRLMSLVKSGLSIHKAFNIMVDSMNQSWGSDDPFAVFSVIRVLLNGETTVLSYEIPDPLLISPNTAVILDGKITTSSKAIIKESHTVLKAGEGILLFSDGISQAGLGNGWPLGWESKGVARYLTSRLMEGAVKNNAVAENVLNHALGLWGKKQGDDCSLVHAHCRNGVIVNLLTGPPQDKRNDAAFVSAFLENKGFKVVCGGTTAKMLARETNKKLEINEDNNSFLTPAAYRIEGINMVTEGMVTLNQVYNILDEDLSGIDDDSPVYRLCEMLNLADRINIYCGTAVNKDEKHLMFRQQGLIARHDIVRLLLEKLTKKGKLLVMKNEFNGDH